MPIAIRTIIGINALMFMVQLIFAGLFGVSLTTYFGRYQMYGLQLLIHGEL